jgi:hypothetical protein
MGFDVMKWILGFSKQRSGRNRQLAERPCPSRMFQSLMIGAVPTLIQNLTTMISSNRDRENVGQHLQLQLRAQEAGNYPNRCHGIKRLAGLATSCNEFDVMKGF